MRKCYLPIILLLYYQASFGQSWLTIGTNGGAGTFASTNNTYGPFSTNTSVSWNRHAYIYPVSLITQMSANSTIDSLFFPRVTQTGVYGSLSGTVNCKIYLKNTLSADFGPSALEWVDEIATATLIYDGDPSTIIGSTGGFKKFELTTPFLYAGSSLEMLVEYIQSAPATGEVIWGYDNNADVPEYTTNSTKYISGSTGAPTNSLTNSNPRHPALAIFYTSLNPVDADAVRITDPPIVSCYDSPQTFSVEVKNAGTTPIAPGAAAVTLQITGANSFTSALSNLAAIAPGSSEFIDFVGVDMSNPGVSNDTAFVTLASDPITINDTAVLQTYTAETISAFPATEDVEGLLPVLGYSSELQLYNAWFVQTGNYTNGDQPSPLTPHGGSTFFLFDSYNYPAGTASLLYSNCLALSLGSSSRVDFYMSHDNLFASSVDSLHLTISTDKGVTWNRIAGFRRYNSAFTTPGWGLETVDLSAYAGSTIQIGFEATSDYGNAIGLDDVTILAGAAAPVTIITFSATKAANTNKLSWATSQELNTSYFVIERSLDGINFNEIGRVSAAGSSSIQRQYNFVDRGPVKGLNYYRLKIVDTDNSMKYSVVKAVRNDGQRNLTVYPNPVKNRLRIDIESHAGDEAELVIADLKGRSIYKSRINLLAGSNTVAVDVTSFAKGAYFINLRINNENFVRKFNKQ